MVFIIDDDLNVCRSLALLIKSSGYDVETYVRAEDFLLKEPYIGTGCILLDVFLEGKSGLELQEEIRNKLPNLPIIYISGLGNIPMSVQALRNGALNFLQKPIDDQQLLSAIDEALKISAEIVNKREESDRLTSLINSLTPREYEIYLQIIKGKLNKQVAAELNITEHTVKLHRGKVTEKLGVRSVAEMVKLAQKLNLL